VAGLKARASAASIEIPNNRVECTSVVKNEQNITETGEKQMVAGHMAYLHRF